MADSFALGDDGSVVTQQANAVAAPSASVTGGGVSSLPVIRLDAGNAPQVSGANLAGLAGAEQQQEKAVAAGAQTLNALGKIVGGKLDQMVSQAQQEQYFQGMAKVTQGQALVDIQKEQPWYTKIFGPDATVRGAQAMTAMTTLQDSQIQFLNNMPELKKSSPDDVRQWLVKQASAIDVGDPATNAMIQSKLAEQWGSMLEIHTKQHYAWQQQQSANSYGNMQLSAGGVLQATSRQGGAGFLSTEKGQLMAQQTVDQIDTNPGMDDDTFKKAALQAAQANVSTGNYVYGNLFQKSQVYQSLDADTKAKFQQYQDRAETKGLQDLELSDFGIRKADLLSAARLGTISRNAALKGLSELNAEVTQATGISQPFVTGAQVQSAIEGNNSALIRAQDRLQAKADKQQEAADKAMAKATDVRNAVGMAAAGMANTAIAAGQVTSSEMGLLTGQQFVTLGQQGGATGPAQQAAYAVALNKDGYISPQIQDTITAGVRQAKGVGYTNGLDQSLGFYRNIRDAGPGGLAAADAYFGNDAHFMDQLYSLTGAGMPTEAAYEIANAQPAKLNNIANAAGGFKQGRQALQKAVKDTYTSWAPTWMGGQNAAPYVLNTVANAVANKADAYVGNSWDLNTAVGVAAKNAGVDMIGEDGYVRKPNQMTVAQTIHIPDDAIGITFSALRDQKLTAIGADKSQIQSLQRVDDPTTGKVNMYMILANPDTGAVTTVPFTQDELLGSYNNSVVQKDLKKHRANKFTDEMYRNLPAIAY